MTPGAAVEGAVAARADLAGAAAPAGTAARPSAKDEIDTLLAEIEARARGLRLQADASEELRGALGAAERRAEELTAALEGARADAAAVREAREAAEARVRELSAGLDAARAESAELSAALKAAEARITQLTARHEDAERRAEQLTDELDQALTEAAWLDKEMESAWRAVEAQTAARAAAEAELAKVRREAEAKEADLAGRLATSTAEADRLRDRLRAVEARLKRVHANLMGGGSGEGVADTVAPDGEPPVETETVATAAGAAPGTTEEGNTAAVVVAPAAGKAAAAATVHAAHAARREAGTAAARGAAAPAVGKVEVAAAVGPAPAPRQPPPELAALGARRTERGLEMIVPGDKLFRFDSDEIHPAAGDVLAQVGRVLEFYRGRDVLIVGHSDSTGDPTYNKLLSERRARAVRDYFLGTFDVGERNLRITGLGPSQPIASNATSWGRRQNRRVEVVVLD